MLRYVPSVDVIIDSNVIRMLGPNVGSAISPEKNIHPILSAAAAVNSHVST